MLHGQAANLEQKIQIFNGSHARLILVVLLEYVREFAEIYQQFDKGIKIEFAHNLSVVRRALFVGEFLEEVKHQVDVELVANLLDDLL